MLEKLDPLAKAPLTPERLVTSDLSVPLKPPVKPNAMKRAGKTLIRFVTEDLEGAMVLALGGFLLVLGSLVVGIGIHDLNTVSPELSIAEVSDTDLVSELRLIHSDARAHAVRASLAEAEERGIPFADPVVWEKDSVFYVGLPHVEASATYALECKVLEEATCSVPAPVADTKTP